MKQREMRACICTHVMRLVCGEYFWKFVLDLQRISHLRVDNAQPCLTQRICRIERLPHY